MPTLTTLYDELWDAMYVLLLIGFVIGNTSLGLVFVRRRGLAISVAFAGVGFGSIVMLPALQAFVERNGWRAGCTLLGVTVLVVLVPLNLLLRRPMYGMGQAMMIGMRKGLLDAGVPIAYETPLTGLVVEDGRVVGVRVQSNGAPAVVRARYGVVLASGGFEKSERTENVCLDESTGVADGPVDMRFCCEMHDPAWLESG